MEHAHEKICRYLDEHGVDYQVIKHEPVASVDEYHNVVGTRYEQQAKAIFIRVRRQGEKTFAMLAIQAQKRADMQRLAELLGAREVRMATREQLAEHTGCSYGELPPLGRLFGFRLLFDKDLLNEDEVYFNAGDLSTSISLDPKAIVELEQPTMY